MCWGIVIVEICIWKSDQRQSATILFCTALAFPGQWGLTSGNKTRLKCWNKSVLHVGREWMYVSHITWGHGYFERPKVPNSADPKTFHGKFCVTPKLSIWKNLVKWCRAPPYKSGHMCRSDQKYVSTYLQSKRADISSWCYISRLYKAISILSLQHWKDTGSSSPNT